MSRLGPLVAALAVFPLIALAAAVPYIAHQYRRRGTVGAGHLLLAGALGLYLVGLAFYVILPLRPVTPDFCDLYAVEAYYSPLRIVDEIRAETVASDWRTLLGSVALQQLVLNVALFVPLGMFARHLLGRGLGGAVALGFGVSLVIELTQLTGNWGLYPCAYRYFDTADLIANTSGAAIGAIVAPLLRLVPAQRALEPPGAPRTVTPARRLLGAACDAALVLAAGIVLLGMAAVVLELARGQLFDPDSLNARALRAVTLVWAPGIALLLLVPLARQGRTPGDWAVLIRPTDTRGGAPGPVVIAGRFLAGPAPLLALAGLWILGIDAAWAAAAVVAVLQLAVLLATPRGGDGAALTLLGPRLDDARRKPG